MFQALLALLLLLAGQSVLGVRKTTGNSVRDDRSLLNTFPFNDGDHQGDHHAVNARQTGYGGTPGGQTGYGGTPNLADVADTRAGSDGKRCINKVEIVEEIEWDEEVQCDHSYDTRCHTSYVTNYDAQQEEECDENYRKNCFIEYEAKAITETVQVCRTPLVKDCNIQGPDICRTEYESECWTKQEEHDVYTVATLEETVIPSGAAI